MAPEGMTVPWGQKASKRLHSVSIWQSPDHLLQTGGHSKKGRKQDGRDKSQGEISWLLLRYPLAQRAGDQIARLMAALTRARAG